MLYLICFNSAFSLPENTSQELLRFKIYGSSTSPEGNTVSGTLSIVDSNGNEIATIERSWSGSYLAVEFSQVVFNDKHFIFPSKVYGKNRIIEERKERKKGTSLEKYYNEDHQCMLLGHGSSLKNRKALYWIGIFAVKKYPIFTFGLTRTYTLDLSDCKSEKYYSISCEENGKISIIEL